MAEPKYAEADGKYFPGGDDKGDEMLLELFDHSIDKDLSKSAEKPHE